MGRIVVATAGWSVPKDVAHCFPGEGAHLERYARVLDGAEINSTFHRRHRPSTFVNWAQSVPASFRFACKAPRTITHDKKLVDAAAELDAFLDDIAGLGDRLGPILVQLPGKLAFDAKHVERFFTALRARFAGPVACEPRNATWYDDAATALLTAFDVARVVADPPRPAAAVEPAGAHGLVYFRMHGAPRTYYSSYDEAALTELAQRMRGFAASADVWCVLDNTAAGAAAENALRLVELLAPQRPARA